MIRFVNTETTAAIILVCAGIIHNFNFMCHKLPQEHIDKHLKVPYPTSGLGYLIINLSWVAMALYGFALCNKISTLLCGVAVASYFLVFPFVLQPPFARLLGFKNLTDYADVVDGINKKSN